MKIEIGKRYYHGLFGWCTITHPPTGNSPDAKTMIDCEAKVIEYTPMYKPTVRHEKDVNQIGQMVCVPISELFESEESVPAIYGLMATAMNLKLTL